MLSYLTEQAPGDALTLEPALFALLVVFAVATLLGALIWLLAGRRRKYNPLAATYLGRLGTTLFWVGLSALIVAAFFSQEALFVRRFWLYLMLLSLYAVMAYALYFYFTSWPELAERQRAEREKRRRYIPAAHTLAHNRQDRIGDVRVTRRSKRRR